MRSRLPLTATAALLAFILTSSPSCALTGGPPPAAPATTAPLYSVVKDDNGVWWFQGPDGSRFYSLGVNNIEPEPSIPPRPDSDYYNPVPTEFKGDTDAWASFVRNFLTELGFNTAGAWSSTVLPTNERFVATPILYVVLHDDTRCLAPLQPDFESFVLQNVKDSIAKLPGREGLLGVFLDNEMPWFGKTGFHYIPTYTLLELAFELPTDDARHKAALEFLQSRHGSVESLAAAYGQPVHSWDDVTVKLLRGSTSREAATDREQFTAMLAERFFEVSSRIVRQELPGVLILGPRFPGDAPDTVIRAAGKYCDVISVNDYRFAPEADENTLARFWLLGGRPLMHTDFSFRARANASGNLNTYGVGPVFDTQADRAAAYAALVSDTATVPYVIGSHWFGFADQSPQGRFDGEDGNYGIVDIHNEPYPEMVAAMKATNASVPALHASTKRVMPTELRPRMAASYSPGQHPERPPTLGLIGDWVGPPETWAAPDAKISWEMTAGELVLKYEAGTQYGAGINLFGPKANAIGHGRSLATDLDGYASILIDVTAPKGLQLNIVLAEAGSATIWTPKFDTSAGDDGEAFTSIPLFGTGVRTTHRLPIDGLLLQQFYGNQAGARRIDMQAVRSLGLVVSGEPGTGTVVVHRLELVR